MRRSPSSGPSCCSSTRAISSPRGSRSSTTSSSRRCRARSPSSPSSRSSPIPRPSPVKALVRAIVAETQLTKEPAQPRRRRRPRRRRPRTRRRSRCRQLQSRANGLQRIGINLVAQQGRRPARAAGRVAGAGRQHRGAVPGLRRSSSTASPAPIDALVARFGEIFQSLVVAARSPSQAQQATANLQLQVANLSMNASRLPEALRRMVIGAVTDLESDAAGIEPRAAQPAARRQRHARLRRHHRQPLPVRQQQLARRADDRFRAALRAERRDRPLLRAEPCAARRPLRRDLDLARRTPRSAASSRTRRCASSSAPPKSATPSSRRGRRRRRSR